MMSNPPVISVIIPVYNVETYIEKCIRSLLNQTYSNFEALIIDDSSPDQSIEITKKLVNKDPRFVFLEKENGGLSSARNFGLDHASGSYIAFLDSDDYLAKDCLEKCINILNRDALIDAVIFGTNWVEGSGKLIKKTISDVEKYYDQEDILLVNSTIEVMAWNKIYKKEMFQNYRFTEGLIYEDSDLIYRVIYQRNIYLLNEYLYFYVQRKGSIIDTYDVNRVMSFKIIIDGYKRFLRAQSLYEKYEEVCEKQYLIVCFLARLTDAALYSNRYLEDIHQLISMLDAEKISLKNICRFYPIHSKIFLGTILFKVSPLLFRKIYRWKFSRDIGNC